jgi:hypothetical protein
MDRKLPYNFWCVCFTLLNSSSAYVFGRKVDSELYLHVKASTRAAEDAEVRFSLAYAR